MEDNQIIKIKKITSDFLINEPKSEQVINTNNITNLNQDNNNISSIYFYDNFSKKILELGTDFIRIYNKNASKIRGLISFNIHKEFVINLTVDKKLKYLLCLQLRQKDKSSKKSTTNLLLLNIEKKTYCDKLQDNFDFFLGMFFLGRLQDNIFTKFNNNYDENFNDFCLIFCDKVIFYSVDEILSNDKESTNHKEKIKKLNKIDAKSIGDKILIKDFCYNYKYKILLLVKTDLNISFINCSNRKYYSQIISPNLSFHNPIKCKYPINNDFKKRIQYAFCSQERYTQTQFYLETLYNSLYFICLSYEDNYIYICELKTLELIEIKTKIFFDKHTHLCALQVVDNLILIHSFFLRNLYVIDIKSKNPIINISEKVNFPYLSNLFINGELLEERRTSTSIKNTYSNVNIYFQGGILYELYFDAINYEKQAQKEIENSDDKNKINLYDLLKNLINRKNAKELILKNIYNIIISNKKCNSLILFYDEIVSKINESIPKIEILQKETEKKTKKENENNAIIIPKPSDLIMKKKNYINQFDIFITIFEKIVKTIENTTENDKFISRVIFYMTQFANKLRNSDIKVLPCYNSIILKFLKLIKNKEVILEIITNKNVIFNAELAKYLLELSLDRNNTYSNFFEFHALNILKRLKKYDIIIDFYFNNKNISLVMNYLNDVSSEMTPIQINNIIKKYKDIIFSNSEIIKNFMK